ncbi:Putative uncharacterized protein [Taphrina deformans PYCC 5710]|uniref:RGS domain-containing protein n=1 Tax=Taphrina deformans (strain PYCC 5710 / ATCC 11124 / CBS 356.35 / IMI 108563 / JCM 9778 / NBRC 8474) TaxID=1097556 RepID=R4XCQ3_TAPDE|nr:Putative uncharacterized protein [Taphrina deformans PYCC 5710]|eukprot:CCG83403.1 Putative uncharacterized protein [Taphrina deformans PYCC 5710]
MLKHIWELFTFRLTARSDGHTQGISDVLGRPSAETQLDRIVHGRNCPPLSLRDLMYFCDYVEFTAENLLFHLEYLNYVRKWKALSDDQRAASPIYSSRLPLRSRIRRCVHDAKTVASEAGPPSYGAVRSRRSSSQAGSSVMNSSPASQETLPPFSTCNGEQSPSMEEEKKDDYGVQEREIAETLSQLPLRAEVERFVTLYLEPNSNRQLNLSHAMRTTCLEALEHTSHPDVLQPVADHIYSLLLRGTLPNFLHYAVKNANGPRRVFAMIMSILPLLLVLALTVLNIVQKKPKALRAVGIPGFWFSTACLLAGLRGSCFFLALKKQVQVRPYYADNDEITSSSHDFELLQYGLRSNDAKCCPDGEGSNTSAWMKKSMFWKTFGRTRSTEGLYRHIQNALVVQCIVHALIITIICSLIIAAIPVFD